MVRQDTLQIKYKTPKSWYTYSSVNYNDYLSCKSKYEEKEYGGLLGYFINKGCKLVSTKWVPFSSNVQSVIRLTEKTIPKEEELVECINYGTNASGQTICLDNASDNSVIGRSLRYGEGYLKYSSFINTSATTLPSIATTTTNGGQTAGFSAQSGVTMFDSYYGKRQTMLEKANEGAQKFLDMPIWRIYMYLVQHNTYGSSTSTTSSYTGSFSQIVDIEYETEDNNGINTCPVGSILVGEDCIDNTSVYYLTSSILSNVIGNAGMNVKTDASGTSAIAQDNQMSQICTKGANNYVFLLRTYTDMEAIIALAISELEFGNIPKDITSASTHDLMVQSIEVVNDGELNNWHIVDKSGNYSFEDVINESLNLDLPYPDDIDDKLDAFKETDIYHMYFGKSGNIKNISEEVMQKVAEELGFEYSSNYLDTTKLTSPLDVLKLYSMKESLQKINTMYGTSYSLSELASLLNAYKTIYHSHADLVKNRLDLIHYETELLKDEYNYSTYVTCSYMDNNGSKQEVSLTACEHNANCYVSECNQVNNEKIMERIKDICR